MTVTTDLQEGVETKPKRRKAAKNQEAETPVAEGEVVVKKEDCPECKDLPEGEVVSGHFHRIQIDDGLSEIPDEQTEEVFDEEMPADRRDPRFSEFTIKKVTITESGNREMAIEIKKTFDKIYTHYVVEMVANLDVLDWRIEQKKKDKANYEAQNQMDAFDDMKKHELEEYDRRIEQLIEERAERLAQCPKITFEVEVKNYGKKPDSTDFVFWIPKEIIGELNDKISFQASYKIELIKNLNND